MDALTEWTLWYDEHRFTPLTSIGLARALTRGMMKTLGVRFSEIVDLVYDKDHLLILAPKKEMDDIVNGLVARILEDPVRANSFNNKMMRESERMLEAVRKDAYSAKTASNGQLADFHGRFARMTDEMFRFGLISVLAESNEGALSQAYYEKVKGKIGNGNFPAVADLLAPAEPSAPLLQRIEMLELVLDAKDGKEVSKIKEEHFGKWRWLPYAVVGPAWKESEFQEEFHNEEKRSKADLQKEIAQAKGRKAEVERKREMAMKTFGFDAYERKLTRVIARFAETKYQRKENFTHAHYEYHPVLSEIAKRLDLSLGEVRLLTPQETEEALLKGKLPDVSERTTLCAFVHKKGITQALGKKDAHAWEKVLPKIDVSKNEEIIGQCACPGYAKGRAVIVNTEKDVHKLKPGDVLFSYATAPELMSAIRNASAIVTDRGGVTCHAAIVSRELNLPCVIGTKIGTAWVREGQTIEVDASKGLVRRMR